MVLSGGQKHGRIGKTHLDVGRPVEGGNWDVGGGQTSGGSESRGLLVQDNNVTEKKRKANIRFLRCQNLGEIDLTDEDRFPQRARDQRRG